MLQWVFHGHNADGTVTFTAYMQAVREEHVARAARTSPAGELVPTAAPPDANSMKSADEER
jgi:hypothetical protein